MGKGSRVSAKGSGIKGQWSQLKGQESEVMGKDHCQGVTGQSPLTTYQRLFTHEVIVIGM